MSRILQKALLREQNNENVLALLLNQVHKRESQLFETWHLLQPGGMMCIMQGYAELKSLNFEIRLSEQKYSVTNLYIRVFVLPS